MDSPASSEEDNTEVSPVPQNKNTIDSRRSSDDDFVSHLGDNSGFSDVPVPHSGDDSSTYSGDHNDSEGRGGA